jgi:hypothetical protein
MTFLKNRWAVPPNERLRFLVVRHVRAAFASGEILDADTIAKVIRSETPAPRPSQSEISEMVVAEASRYGGSGIKVGASSK